MIDFAEAYRLVKEKVEKLEDVVVDLPRAIGYVLAEDVFSDIDMPPFDKSFRDGYAVRASDCVSAPVTLKVIGESKAGRAFNGGVGEGEAVSIMTGAPVPRGADAVIMVEDTTQSLRAERSNPGHFAPTRVQINVSARPGTFMCRRGDDVARGTKVLEKGAPLREAELAVLATVGKSQVKVFRRPTVAVIVTGDELVEPGSVPNEWQIRDCNGPLLVSMLEDDGYKVRNLGIVADEREVLQKAIETGLECDVLLLSGGVSAGKYDFVPEILESLGVKSVFHKVRMKPGKPIYFGKLDKKCIFGMPGNPISAFLSYKVWVRLALSRMMGVEDSGIKLEKGMLIDPITEKNRRKTFVPVFATQGEDGWLLKPSGWRGSADIFALTRSNAFAVIEAGSGGADSGAELEFLRW